ncbi:VOC family protein [Salinisphaera sp. Q1T1-3]|uniref:VOC family protein n=1 Tax=Salinisphaera sp. Q1T1-3 TaxID=2321229 RepID=UPI001F1EF3EC|nr:VOC family protein [Salinisphaera sp. Q1T1-3]
MTKPNDIVPAPLSVADVSLVVRDLARVSTFYQRMIGLQPLATDRTEHVLGAGGQPLLRLRADPQARLADRHAAGLFHTAFLMPNRADLGAWLHHALAADRARLSGASDHAVSEALYLADPEGNGIEIYTDRPRAQWRWVGAAVEMSTMPLDVDDLLRAARPRWQGVPEATRIGHVHLQVGDIDTAEAFYRDRLGLATTHHRPGARFFASGGYHHHIATNTWHSAGAGGRTNATTGLAAMTLEATSDGEYAPVEDRTRYLDPWGIVVDVVPRTASSRTLAS